jgi:4-hydroxybenzoate polyprenyltransferase
MAVPLAGALLAGATIVQLILVFIIFFFLISYAFTVNNYFDVEIDRFHIGKVHSKKNPLASGSISLYGVKIIMLIQISIALFSIERVILDLITHGLMFGAVPFLAGFALCTGSISSNTLFSASPLFILGGEALIAHQIVEYEEDIKSTRTTVTIIGQRNGLLLLGILALLSVGALFFANNTQHLPFWAVVGFGWYLVAYPAYSCRSIFHDIRHSASPE